MKNTGLQLDADIMKALADIRPKRCSASELFRKMAVVYLMNKDFRNAVDHEIRQEYSEIADELEGI